MRLQITTPEAAAAWLAGFIDGEGCVHERVGRKPGGKLYHNRIVTIVNTERALIVCAARCCRLLGIAYRRYDRPGLKAHHKHRYYLDVGRRRGFVALLQLVPLQSPAKQQRLQRLVDGLPTHRCSGCSCQHDEFTPGCSVCDSRRYMRRWLKRRRQQR